MADFEGIAPPDEYERRYMEGDRAIVRARQRQAAWVPLAGLSLMALYLVLAWPVLAWAWSVRAHPGATAVLGYFVAVMLFNFGATLFSMLAHHITRVVLTATHLHVHRGLRTHDIALGAITAVRDEVAARLPEHTLWGAITRREWTYATVGAARTLRVDYDDDRGRACTLWVQFDDAGAVRERIEALRSGRTGVRAVDDAVDAAGEDAEAEGEARATRATRAMGAAGVAAAGVAAKG